MVGRGIYWVLRRGVGGFGGGGWWCLGGRVLSLNFLLLSFDLACAAAGKGQIGVSVSPVVGDDNSGGCQLCLLRTMGGVLPAGAALGEGVLVGFGGLVWSCLFLNHVSLRRQGPVPLVKCEVVMKARAAKEGRYVVK